jgi:hypothetical protein
MLAIKPVATRAKAFSYTHRTKVFADGTVRKIRA